MPDAIFSSDAVKVMSYRDASLYRGHLVEALDIHVEKDFLRLTNERSMSSRRARLVVETRLVLRASFLFEGWGVALARSIGSGRLRPRTARTTR